MKISNLQVIKVNNQNLTIDFIKDNMDKNWNWSVLSHNICITYSFIKDNLDKPWDWIAISKNPIITMEIIKNNINDPWNWYNGVSLKSIWIYCWCITCCIYK